MISLPPDILAQLDARVADQGSNRAVVIREIIIAAFN
jgi:metal-responsive CopG/Arc/MetJ family transcriptional regulator